jgi:quaternary ammonium compound-resistance protein SugE
MSWLILVLSGALEAVWAAALHRTSQATGRRRLIPGLVFLGSVIASTGGLAVAMQSIPTGTAYAVWVGVGVVLTSGYAMIAKVERATAARILLLGGIAASVVGLKLVA